MTYTGWGVWAIVWYQITNLFVNVLLLWVLSKWRPKLIYSWKSFRELFNFGSKLAISGIIDTLYTNIYLIVIGKVFKASDLGYYTRAQQFAAFPSSNLTSIIQRVTFPVLCSIQNDDQRLRSVYRRFLRLSAFVIFPLMIGLAVLAKPVILLLLKEQWAFAATLLSIICFQMMWYPIHGINLSLLQVKGRSDLFLKLEIWKKCVGVAILCATIPFGLVAMCLGGILTSLICLVINTYYTGKLIEAGFWLQMQDLLPAMIYSMTMGVVVFISVYYIPSMLLKLIIGTIIGILYYFTITKITDSQDLRELKTFISN